LVVLPRKKGFHAPTVAQILLIFQATEELGHIESIFSAI
jgi:hypothetical protein